MADMSQEVNMADGSRGDSLDAREIGTLEYKLLDPFIHLFLYMRKLQPKNVDPISIMGSVTREEYFKFPKRGKCYIFNHREFDPHIRLKVRKGTDIDAACLHLRFKDLGFETKVFDDLPVREVLDKLEKVSKEDYSQYSAFVCCILSHGKYGILYARDGIYETEKVFAPFRGDVCSTLLGKPKMFFIQACQGDELDPGVNVDCKESTDATSQFKIPTHADFLIMYSTIPGFYSWRSKTNGSWFIQALCAALEEHSHNKDLLQILTVVNRKVAFEFESYKPQKLNMHEKKQVPLITSTLTRDVKFT